MHNLSNWQETPKKIDNQSFIVKKSEKLFVKFRNFPRNKKGNLFQLKHTLEKKPKCTSIEIICHTHQPNTMRNLSKNFNFKLAFLFHKKIEIFQTKKRKT